MRSLLLNDAGSLQRCGSPALHMLRLVILWGLRERAQGIDLTRHGDQVEFSFRYPDRMEPLIPPPAYLADEIAEEVRRLARWRERVADRWERWRGCKVLAEREGTARVLLGGPDASLHYWLLPYWGGMLLGITLVPEPMAAERAAEILAASEESSVDLASA